MRPTGCLSECLALPTNDLISQKNSSISYVIFPAGQRNRLSLSTPSPLNPFLSPVQPGPRVLYFLIPCPLSGAMVFSGSSAGKEFICNAGDPSLIPGSGRSPGEGIGYPLQYSWASLVAQMVKNLLQCGRPGFSFWAGKIPWRRIRQLSPVCLPGESPWTEEPGGLQSMELQRVGPN